MKIEAHTWGTDENDADTYNKCTVCGLAKPADKEEIVDGDADKKNDANHGDECTWVKDESKADKAATCTEDGVSYFICKKTVTVDEQETEVGCGATKTVTTPATGHTAADTPTEEVTKEPTCMATGTKKVTVTCKTCSAKISESSVTINVDEDAHDVAEGARWVSDEEGHWHACKLNSNHKADYAVHDYQEDAETGKKVCECGKEEPCKHANKSYEALANKKHKVTCDDCDEVISASADCTAGDWVASGDDMVKKCTACEQVLETCTHENVTYGAAAGDEGAKKHSATCADCAKQLDPVDCTEDENCQYCKTEAPDTPSTGR